MSVPVLNVAIETDELGRYVCTLDDGETRATVTASNVPDAAEQLLQALDDARETGYGECLWDEQGGGYRWMFRREGERLTVAVMWCHGIITGWQHVFRTDCAFEPFARDVRARLGVRS